MFTLHAMKKYCSLFLIMVSLVFLVSCSKNTNSDDDGGSSAVDRSGNILPTGASANDLLANTNFDRILIEAAYVEGFRPTNEAMNNFQDFLLARTFKTDVEIEYLELESPNEETLTLIEVDNLERQNRTRYNDGGTLAVYIYFADAPSEDDDEDEGLVTLGAVYRNTSMIIYERTVRNLANRAGFLQTADVETATLNHEFGHLFGLVNISGEINGQETVFTPMVNPHEGTTTDEDGNIIGNDHCNVEGCLMQAQLQFTPPSTKKALTGKTSEVTAICNLSGKSVLALLQSRAAQNFMNVVPEIDPECILDLQNNGGR